MSVVWNEMFAMRVPIKTIELLFNQSYKYIYVFIYTNFYDVDIIIVQKIIISIWVHINIINKRRKIFGFMRKEKLSASRNSLRIFMYK